MTNPFSQPNQGNVFIQPNPFQNSNQFYPSAYGVPNLSDIILKSFDPEKNGGSMNRSDWLKFGINNLGNLFNQNHQMYGEGNTPF